MKTLVIFIADPLEQESDVKYAVLDGDHADSYHDKWINGTDLTEQDEKNLNEIAEMVRPERPALNGEYKIAVCGFFK